MGPLTGSEQERNRLCATPSRSPTATPMRKRPANLTIMPNKRSKCCPRRTVNTDHGDDRHGGNSQVVIRATEQFLAYFHDARFTVTTAMNSPSRPAATLPKRTSVRQGGGTRLTSEPARRPPEPDRHGERQVTFSAQTLDAHDAAHLPHHHLRCQKRGQRHADHHTRRGLHRCGRLTVGSTRGAIDDTERNKTGKI